MIPTASILADLYAPVRGDLHSVNQIIESELASAHDVVNQLCQHVGQYRGKMLRPALLLLSGRATGQITQEHRVLAAVVEIVHLATLVHDDVLDHAEFRRQHPTINATNGNTTAVLLGDYLISHAYHLCSQIADSIAARTVASTTNAVCEGELLQVSRRHDLELSEDAYLEIIAKKTAALTATCCALGATYSGAEPSVIRSLHEFGMSAGIAFQIVDDVLDLTGDEWTTGKSLGRDLTLGNATLPVIHAMRTLSPNERREICEALTSGDSTRLATVRRAIDLAGSLDYALDRARQFVERARSQLCELAASPAKDSLHEMAEFIIRRHF